MRMRDLADALPSSRIVSGADLTEASISFEPGDFLLSRAHGHLHKIIKFGQGLRITGADRCYADYTHAALVVSREGDLIEAIGEGVRRTTLLQYVVDREDFQVVRIESDAHDRQQVVDFAHEVLEAKAPYGFFTTLSITLWAFTGCRLTFFLDGSFTCSGLVAAALERTSAHFRPNPVRMMPAQLAVLFQAPPPPDRPRDDRRVRRWTRRDD